MEILFVNPISFILIAEDLELQQSDGTGGLVSAPHGESSTPVCDAVVNQSYFIAQVSIRESSF